MHHTNHHHPPPPCRKKRQRMQTRRGKTTQTKHNHAKTLTCRRVNSESEANLKCSLCCQHTQQTESHTLLHSLRQLQRQLPLQPHFERKSQQMTKLGPTQMLQAALALGLDASWTPRMCKVADAHNRKVNRSSCIFSLDERPLTTHWDP
jgi:hypothetical protein